MLKYLIWGFCLLLTNPAIAQIDFSIQQPLKGAKVQTMDSLIKAGTYERITSVLVVQKGQLIYESYYQGLDSTALHNTRSATKTMATLLTGMAIKQGYIHSEQDKIYQYLSHKLPVQNPDPRKDSITIEDLLTMSSVLECDDWNQFSRGHEERMYFIEDWTQFLLDLPVRSYPFGPPPADRPYGRAFAYGSAKSAAVAEIVQTAISQPVDDYLRTQLFAPLGITSYELHYSPMGILNTAGGSEYRSRDFLKLIQLCLNGGRWNNQQLIDSEWITKSTTPKANAYEGHDYGYLFWLSKFGEEKQYSAYYMAGNGGNKVMAIPELELAIVITATNYNNRNAHNYSDEIINRFILPAVLHP